MSLSINTASEGPGSPRRPSAGPASPRVRSLNAASTKRNNSSSSSSSLSWLNTRVVATLMVVVLGVLVLEESVLLGLMSQGKRVKKVASYGAELLATRMDKTPSKQGRERFPVLTMCPTSLEYEDQIKAIRCRGLSGSEPAQNFTPEVEQVHVGAVEAGGLYECYTVNKLQTFVGNSSQDVISCDLTYNKLDSLGGRGQARVTSWGNGGVWPTSVFQAPSASVYSWRNVTSLQTTRLRASLIKVGKGETAHWLTDLRVSERESGGWEGSGVLEKTQHSSFVVGLSDFSQRIVPGEHGDAAAGGGEAADKPSVWTVFYCTLVMALCTALGAVPFFFTDRLDKSSEGVAQSMAIGVMIAASYALIQESEGLNNAWLVVGLAAGMVFIDRSHKFLSQYDDGMEFIGLKGMDAKKILLFLGIMTLHAVGEGCGVGVSYAGPQGFPKGLLITMAIGIHNIPEGLATATILASKNVGKRDMVLWTVFTALPQTLLAVPAYMFVQVFHSLFPFFAGFAAGCMIWISFAEIVPDALENVSPSTMATTTTTTTFAFKAMQYALDYMLLG